MVSEDPMMHHGILVGFQRRWCSHGLVWRCILGIRKQLNEMLCSCGIGIIQGIRTRDSEGHHSSGFLGRKM